MSGRAVRQVFGAGCRRIVRAVALCGFVVSSAARLAWAWRKLRRTRAIVVIKGWGFGDTITGVEAMRRLFNRERPIAILLSDRPFHNSSLSLLWSDIDVLCFRFLWQIRLGDWAMDVEIAGPRTRRALEAMLFKYVAWCSHAQITPLVNVYELLTARRPIEAIRGRSFIDWIPGWTDVVERAPGLQTHLPERTRREIHRRLVRFMTGSHGHGEAPRFCCLYLRGKGGHLTSARRIGSPVEAYVPALESVIAQGYTVLVTGDRLLDSRYAQRFHHRLITSEFAGVSPGLFQLFAATESAVWVGDHGGGTWLPIINNIPMLVVNAFPFGFGVPNAWMHYKTVTDVAGNLIPYRRLFTEYAYEYELSGLVVCDNSAHQIRAAVEEFLHDVQTADVRSQPDPVMQSLPDHLLGKYVGSRLCRSWLRLYEEVETTVEPALLGDARCRP